MDMHHWDVVCYRLNDRPKEEAHKNPGAFGKSPRWTATTASILNLPGSISGITLTSLPLR